MAALRQSDILAIAGRMLQNRTYEELHIAGELIVTMEPDRNSYIYTVSSARGKVYHGKVQTTFYTSSHPTREEPLRSIKKAAESCMGRR